MKAKIIFNIALIISITIPLSLLNASTSGITFLKVGISPRTLSMGDAYSTNSFEPSSTFYNPASLGFLRTTELQIIHKEWFRDSRSDFIGFASGFGNMKLGLGLNSFSIQNIEIRTRPGEVEGTFTARNAALSLSVAYSFNEIYLGATGKFLYEKIFIHEASGFAFDLGAVYTYLDKIFASISINNIGKMNPLFNEKSDLPTNLRLAISSSFNVDNLKLIFSPAINFLSFFNEHKNHIHSGLEIEYDKLIALRFGIQSGYLTHTFSSGFGIKYKLFSFDYAFIPFKYELGNSHTFSIKVIF